MLYSLKGSWIEELVKIIKHNFSGVGKGWFNMQETSKITYDFGKLKRFLTVARLMMQDSILALIKKNYADLKAFILGFLPNKVQVISPSKVIN
jgi:dynein heavy chain